MSSEERKSNVSKSSVPLTDQEAAELFELLEAFVNSRQFIEAGAFVESLTRHDDTTLTAAKEIYFSMRRRRGRSRVASGYHWSEFLVRLGIRGSWYPKANTTAMSNPKFLELERELLFTAGVNPRVMGTILELIEKFVPKNHTDGRVFKLVRLNDIKDGILQPFENHSFNKKGFGGEIPSSKIASAMILVADISVLFTTRDWSVAGTLSAIAGAAVTQIV